MRPFIIAIVLTTLLTSGLRGQSRLAKTEIQTFALRYAQADEVVEILNEQFLEAFKFTANTRTNTIYGRVGEEYLPEVAKFIEQLEQAGAAYQDRSRMEQNELREKSRGELEMGIKVFFLKHVPAEEVLSTIEELRFVEDALVVAAEPRTNSLIAKGVASSMQELETLLMMLDKAAVEQDDPAAEPARPRKRIPVSDLRSRYEYQEREIATAIERWRDRESEEARDQKSREDFQAMLRQDVRRAFDLRQALKRAEIEDAQRQLGVIQQRVNQRAQLADKIIDRRVEDLLGDAPLEWTPLEQIESPFVDDQHVTGADEYVKGPADGVHVEAIDDVVVLRGKKEAVESIVETLGKLNPRAKTTAPGGDDRLPRPVGPPVGAIQGKDPFDAEDTFEFRVSGDRKVEPGDLLLAQRDGQPVSLLRVGFVTTGICHAEVVREFGEKDIEVGDKLWAVQSPMPEDDKPKGSPVDEDVRRDEG